MTTPIRVAVASSGLGHIARGVETWADELGRALHQRQVDVRLYQGGGVPPPYGEALRELPRESAANARWRKLVPRPLGWRMMIGSSYDMEQTTFAFSLLRALRRRPADVLHVQDPVVALRLEQCRRAGLISTRTILAHGTEESDRFLQRLRYVQHLAPTHADAIRARGHWRSTWTAIGNFVDVNRFAPGGDSGLKAELGIPTDAPVVLTVAAIKRVHKRIDWLIDSMAAFLAAFPDNDARLLIAGGWEGDTDELVRYGEEKLGDRVRFLVRFPRARIADLYRSADVFVLASLFEMMPIALLEAAASGLPCMIHPEPTLQWMTGAGGLATPMNDEAAFVASLAQLLGNTSERAAMADAARQHAVCEFSTDVIVDRILDYYRTVVSDPG